MFFKQTGCRWSSHAILLALLCFSLTLVGCGQKDKNLFIPEVTPLFTDDGDIHSLTEALQNQLHYLAGLDSEHTHALEGESVTRQKLIESIDTLLEILSLDPPLFELERIIKENFTVYQSVGREGTPNEMLVTGYFEPILQGSLTFDPPFVFPIYAVPDDLVTRNFRGTEKTGRLDAGGKFVPYWNREEIERLNLLAGTELVYLSNRFDAFLLHVQGSGKIRLQDGSLRSIGYANNNGHPYSSIGKLLVDTNILPLHEVDIPAIQQYLHDHPEQMDDILYHNKRFIFFTWQKRTQPLGSLGEPLTPGRSVAIDKQHLPTTMIGYLITRKPVIDSAGSITGWTTLSRFVLPQDSGAAIKGPGRVDIFWGNDQYAETAAGAMKEQGKLYFLMKK